MERSLRRRSLNFAAVVAAVSMLCTTWIDQPVAQTRTVADIALYKATDRQKVLEDGARNEGAITLYTNGGNMRPIVEAFQKKYPYLKVGLTRDNSADLTRKFLEEYGAGTYLADVVEVSTVGLMLARDRGFLQPYYSIEKQSYESLALGPDDYWVIDREGYTGLAYNTKKIPESEAPKTYADLLDPKWKGRMAMPLAGATANWLGVILLSQGQDYVRKLGQQNIRIYNASSNAVANLVVSGEIEMAPAIYMSQAAVRRKAGGAISWAPLGQVAVLEASIALPAKTKRPHAALLYLDFVLSQEGQLLYRDLDYLSSRKDMPPTGLAPLDKNFVGNRPTYFEDYERWNALLQEVFVRGEPITLKE